MPPVAIISSAPMDVAEGRRAGRRLWGNQPRKRKFSSYTPRCRPRKRRGRAWRGLWRFHAVFHQRAGVNSSRKLLARDAVVLAQRERVTGSSWTEPSANKYEFYDLTVDALEQHSLAHPSIADDLSQRLQERLLQLLIEQLAARGERAVLREGAIVVHRGRSDVLAGKCIDDNAIDPVRRALIILRRCSIGGDSTFGLPNNSTIPGHAG